MSNSTQIDILLVEDNSRDAELTMRALNKRHLANQLVRVKDGAEALGFIFESDATGARKVCRRPKLILLDLKLPKVDGLELLRQLKAHEESRTIPVVMMTSSREEQDIVRSYQLGVNSYIVKPVNFDNFSEAVAQLGMYWLLLNQPPEPPATLEKGKTE
jgi:two-component system, response regulator